MTGFLVGIVDWAAHAEEISAIRDQIFIVEQNVPAELERDPRDGEYTHVLARSDDGQPVGTGRLLPGGRVGRMAVLSDWRGRGVGEAMLKCLMEAARDRGDREIRLNAQETARAFYLRHGFETEGEPFMEAGISHIHMRCVL